MSEFFKRRLRAYMKSLVLLLVLVDVAYFSYNFYGPGYPENFSLSNRYGNTAGRVIGEKTVADNCYTGGSKEADVQPQNNLRLKTLFPPKYHSKESLRTMSSFRSFGHFDRRLLPALWLNLASQHLMENNGKISQGGFTLPFNWDMLNDVAERITDEPYFAKVIQGKMNCEEFKKLAPEGLPQTFLENFCEDYDYKNPNFANDYHLPFKVVRKVDQYLKDVEWRRIYGMMHMLIQAEIPSQVLFMGAAPNHRTLLFPLEKVSNGDNDLTLKSLSKLNSYYDHLIESYVERKIKAESETETPLTTSQILSEGISVYKELSGLQQLLGDSEIFKKQLNSGILPSYPSKNRSLTLIGKGSSKVEPPSHPLKLDESLFKWFLPDEVQSLKNQIERAPADLDSNQLQHLKNWGEQILDPDFKEPWYYGIPSIQGKPLDHYDWRFFHDITYESDPELHQNVLHRLARTWFKLCQEFDVPSWLNHGSLIGWYWNGASMPYDGDLDLQLPIQSLHKLAKFLNNTLIYDFTDNLDFYNNEWQIDNKAELGIRSYLFDVDPLYLDRNGIKSGENNIDARLIDTETGLYIDLTALADFHSETQYDLKVQKKYLEITGWTHTRVMIPPHIDEFFNVEANGDSKFDRDQKKSEGMLKKLIGDIDKAIKKGVDSSVSPGSPTKNLFHNFVHCKHFHTYNLEELFPLIPTYFENSIGYLPANWYRNILIDYGSVKALENDYFERNKFWPSVNLWIGHKDCPVWNFDSGKPNEDENEQDVILKCMEMNPLFEKHIKTSSFYGLQHQLFKNKVMPEGNLKGVVKYDYETELLPILRENKADHPLRGEPFINRFLY